MRYEDIKDQLERYGGEPVKDILPTLDALSDLNDDISHLRSQDCIRESMAKVRKCLDQLAPSPEPHIQGVWDEIGTALALLDDTDVSPKARTLIRTALESVTGQQAPQYLGGIAVTQNSGKPQC